jgi:hypothetical protein
MKPKLWPYPFLFAVLLVASSCLAQKVPVIMQADAGTNTDPIALRFSRSLADEITLSGRFYLWTGKNDSLPPNGVLISVASIQITLHNGSDLGSAICVEAERPSSRDPGYNKLVSQHMLMIPKDSSVADNTRAFLAEVERGLEK